MATIAGKQPELLLQAKNYSGSGDWLDESGNGHDAQFGSTSGADANDPLFKPWNGIDYLYLPGTSGNYASAPDVNLFDADTAHSQQNPWQAAYQATDVQLVATDEALFGDYVTQWESTGAGQIESNGEPLHAVAPSTAYTYSVRLRRVSGTGGSAFALSRAKYNSTPALLGFSSGGTTDLSDGEWHWINWQFTTDATETGFLAQNNYVSIQSGDVYQLDVAMLSLGTVTIDDNSFVPSLRIVGDLEVEAKVAADDWTIGGGASGYQYLFGTLASTLAAADGGWHLSISDVGAVTIMHSDAALADLRTEQSALYTLVDGEATTIKVTFDNSGLVTYYQDGVEVDDDVVTNTGAAGGGTSPLNVGTFDAAAVRMFAGDIYYCIARDGIGGPIVAEYRASDASEPFATHTGSVDGRTWTHNRSSSGLVSTVVDRQMFLLTTDDYFTVAHHADLDLDASQDATFIVVLRVEPIGTWNYPFGKFNSATNTGWRIFYHTDLRAYASIGDGTQVSDQGPNYVTRSTTVLAGRIDRTANELESFVNGVGSGTPLDITAVGSLATALDLYIGRQSASYMEGQILAAALFREKLTDDELLAVGNALAGEGGAVNMMLMGVA